MLSILVKILLHTSQFIIQALLFVLEWTVTGFDGFVRIVTGWFVRPRFIRQGACVFCGVCCRQIGINLPKSWARRPAVVRFFSRWHFLRYNFTLLGVVDNMLVYECGYLAADNRCGIQKFKPRLCREFPSQRLFEKPDLYKGCGYHYVPRTNGKFEATLKRVREKKFDPLSPISQQRPLAPFY